MAATRNTSSNAAAERAWRTSQTPAMRMQAWRATQNPRNIAVQVTLDLMPLSRALADLPKHVKQSTVIVRGLNKGIAKFKSDAHNLLKVHTKIKTPNRLKRGVRIVPAYPARLEASYVIRDRNLRITKQQFTAAYKGSPRLSALIRWGKANRSPLATWTSWDGFRARGKPFMLKGAKAMFIRLTKKQGKGAKPEVVRGPNPAELIRLKAPAYRAALHDAARNEVVRQIALGYNQAVHQVKAKYGL